MKNIKILLLSLATSAGAFAADFDVTPGTLADILLNDGKGQSEIKLKGNIDARDLAALENLPAEVKTLDLSDVTIKGLSMPDRSYFGRTLFSDNEIPEYTFFNLEVETLVLPASLKKVGAGAFASSHIASLVVPEGVESLGDYAFYGCNNLKDVSLPASIKTVGKGAFGNCRELQTIDLSSTGITEIPAQAFSGAVNLESVSLPASVVKIGREAFSHTKIESLDLKGINAFDAYALSGMPFLKSLSINPEARIGDGLLMDNISLTSLSGMPEFLPDYFAANCSILPTETGLGASSLGKYSLANTMAPEVLIIAGGLNSISRGALSGLNTITTIDVTPLENNVPEVNEYSFEGLNQQDIELKVTDESMDNWLANPYWSLFNVKSIGSAEVEDITADLDAQSIEITVRNGKLIVESSSPLVDVRVYSADGRIAFIASPDDNRVEIDSAALPSGILVVAATNAEGRANSASVLLK